MLQTLHQWYLRFSLPQSSEGENFLRRIRASIFEGRTKILSHNGKTWKSRFISFCKFTIIQVFSNRHSEFLSLFEIGLFGIFSLKKINLIKITKKSSNIFRHLIFFFTRNPCFFSFQVFNKPMQSTFSYNFKCYLVFFLFVFVLFSETEIYE